MFDRDLSGWDVKKVTNMNSLFASCHQFNGNVSRWDVARVMDFGSMFRDCVKFNQELSSWDTRKAESMYAMFLYAPQFQGFGLENWDTSKTKLMNSMFREAKAFNGNLSGWDVRNVETMAAMVRLFISICLREYIFCCPSRITYVTWCNTSFREPCRSIPTYRNGIYRV